MKKVHRPHVKESSICRFMSPGSIPARAQVLLPAEGIGEKRLRNAIVSSATKAAKARKKRKK